MQLYKFSEKKNKIKNEPEEYKGTGIWLVWAGGVWGLSTGNQLGLGQINLFKMIIPGFGRVLAL